MSEEKAIDLAYQFVEPSYDWARDRLDKIHDRLQSLQSVMVGVTLAVPVFVKAVMGESPGEVNFGSWMFVTAMILFVLAMVVSLIAQAAGTLTLLTPKALYDEYLDLDVGEFKRDALKWAGEHTKKNHGTVLCKGNAMSAMTALFIAETFLLVLWIVTG